MSVAIVSIPFLEIGDFYFRIKQKTLSYMCLAISPARHLQRYVFFLTMQRSNKNIISSKVKIFRIQQVLSMKILNKKVRKKPSQVSPIRNLLINSVSV